MGLGPSSVDAMLHLDSENSLDELAKLDLRWRLRRFQCCLGGDAGLPDPHGQHSDKDIPGAPRGHGFRYFHGE